MHKPLDLPAGQANAAFADNLLVAERHLADERVRVGHFRDFLDAAPFGRVVAACNVLGNRAGKQQIALHDIADLRAVIGFIDHTEVVAVDRHLALVGA
jgi:hypothetical protein